MTSKSAADNMPLEEATEFLVRGHRKYFNQNPNKESLIRHIKRLDKELQAARTQPCRFHDDDTEACEVYSGDVPCEASAGVVPEVCDGREQEAFEVYASGKGYDMALHPLHYLFINDKTNAARSAWKAAISYCHEAMLTAAPTAPAVEGGGVQVAEVVSGYSGDPDTRGDKALKALDLSQCNIGDKLYTRPHNGEQGGEWVRCDERLPTEADGFFVWSYSLGDSVCLVPNNHLPGMAFKGYSDYWMPTGLKRPAPPTEREGE